MTRSYKHAAEHLNPPRYETKTPGRMFLKRPAECLNVGRMFETSGRMFDIKTQTQLSFSATVQISHLTIHKINNFLKYTLPKMLWIWNLDQLVLDVQIILLKCKFQQILWSFDLSKVTLPKYLLSKHETLTVCYKMCNKFIIQHPSLLHVFTSTLLIQLIWPILWST